MLPLRIGSRGRLSSSTGSLYRVSSWSRWEYVRRLFHVGQMDIEFTLFQMVNLLLRPHKVYQYVAYRKQMKEQWARDDPGFLAVFACFLVTSGLCYGLAFGHLGFRLVLCTVLPLGYFLVMAALASAICYTVAAAHVKPVAEPPLGVRTPGVDALPQLEFAYCVDVHCNATFPLFLLCGVLQYFLLPALLLKGLVPAVCANALYVIGLLYYCYVTTLGYATLPFIDRSDKFMYPAGVIIFLIAILTLFNVNLTRVCLYAFAV
eukprot:GHVT01070906.1.p1 GENE.GHVT01070906.1~~GHVT01070906.1.p1  ORF type:complete len:262 (+),score=11.92 GHVT01070906.1:764-1549(+)